MSRTRPTPPKALKAYELCLENGFVRLEQGLGTLEGTIEGLAAAERPAEAVSVADWIDILRTHARTSWGHIEKKPMHWRAAPSVRFDAERTYNPWSKNQYGRVHVWHPWRADETYPGLLAAHYILKAERRCPAVHADRVFRRLKSLRSLPGYDLTSAFDWYVVQVAALRNSMGLELRGYETLTLSRPVNLPEGVL